ncbi:MAG: metallophosphoesterase [Deltaproteobacteria bacterium]|nr:metallophosphoesterase [Deltaproteobacteria bacterium]
MRVVLLAAVLVLARSASAEGAALRGPYLLDVSSSSVRVVWESPAGMGGSTGTVRWGEATIAEHSRPTSGAALHQSVLLDGLAAATSYVLRVDIDGYGTFDGSFTTAPTAGDAAARFAFVVYGDNRSSAEQHAAVVDAILAEPTPLSFLMNTGDLVSDGQVEADWDSFFTVARPLLLEQPLFVAIGNHEVDGTSFDVTQRIFHIDRAFSSTVYGNAQLMLLNVEVDDLYDFGSSDQVEFLRAALASTPPGVEHRFVFIHQGPYSSKAGRSGNYWLRRWLDDLDDAGVDVIFSGHDHYAERGWSARGTPYVIHGGGGAPLYDHLGLRTTPDHTIVYGETRLGYALVEVDGAKVEVTLRGLEGEIVSYFAFGDAAAPECSAASECGAPPMYGCAGGAWRCRQSACEWVCPDDGGFAIECFTDGACADRLGATCTGEARCQSSGLQFYCVCDDGTECQSSADCVGRVPPVPGCVGTWQCQDSVCEFTPSNGVCDHDAPVADAGTAPDAGGAPAGDAGPLVDAGVSPPADAGAVGGAAPIDAGVVPAGGVDGCGCGQLDLSTWWFAVVLLTRVRRSRGR